MSFPLCLPVVPSGCAVCCSFPLFRRVVPLACSDQLPDHVSYHFGIVLLFEPPDFRRNVLRSVLRCDGRAGLKDNLSSVTNLAHIVDRYSRFSLAGGLHRLVDMASVHPFAAVFGQQGGVDVDYAVGIARYEERRNHKQKACQNDEIDVVPFHQFCQAFFVPECRFVHYSGSDSQRDCPYERVGIGPVAQDENNADVGAAVEVTYDILAVCAVARHEYGYVCHCLPGSGLRLVTERICNGLLFSAILS